MDQLWFNAASSSVMDYALAVAVFPYGENSVLAGSKFGERVYGSGIDLPAHQLEQLLKTVARVAFCQRCQRMDHWFIMADKNTPLLLSDNVLQA